MVMAPAPKQPRPKRLKMVRRLSLRCWLGKHVLVLATGHDMDSRWGVLVRYCARCWKVDHAEARDTWW